MDTDQESACRDCATMHAQLETMAPHVLSLKMQAEAHRQNKNVELEPVVAGLRHALKEKNEQIASFAVQTEQYSAT